MPSAYGGSTISDSAQINPGVIVDSDINASAAIAGSKLQALSVGANAGVIPSTGVADAHIAATAAITLSKLAAITRGGVLIGSTSNVPTVLGPGTSGQFLKTLGAGADPVWGSVSADGLVAKKDSDTTATSTGEQTLWQVSVPASTIPSTGVLRMRALVEFSWDDAGGSGGTMTLRFKYGTTTINTLTLTAPAGNEADVFYGWIEFDLHANAATNAQVGFAHLYLIGLGNDNTRSRSAYNRGTGAEDSTTVLNMTFTAQPSSANAARYITMHEGTLTVLR